MRGEHSLDYLEEDGGEFINDSFSNCDLTKDSATSASSCRSRGTCTTTSCVVLTLEAIVTHGGSNNSSSRLSSCTSSSINGILAFRQILLIYALFNVFLSLLSTLCLSIGGRSALFGFLSALASGYAMYRVSCSFVNILGEN